MWCTLYLVDRNSSLLASSSASLCGVGENVHWKPLQKLKISPPMPVFFNIYYYFDSKSQAGNMKKWPVIFPGLSSSLCDSLKHKEPTRLSTRDIRAIILDGNPYWQPAYLCPSLPHPFFFLQSTLEHLLPSFFSSSTYVTFIHKDKQKHKQPRSLICVITKPPTLKGMNAQWGLPSRLWIRHKPYPMPVFIGRSLIKQEREVKVASFWFWQKNSSKWPCRYNFKRRKKGRCVIEWGRMQWYRR